MKNINEDLLAVIANLILFSIFAILSCYFKNIWIMLFPIFANFRKDSDK